MVGSCVTYGCTDSVKAAPGVTFHTCVARAQVYSKLRSCSLHCIALYLLRQSLIGLIPLLLGFRNMLSQCLKIVSVHCLPFDSVSYQFDVLDNVFLLSNNKHFVLQNTNKFIVFR